MTIRARRWGQYTLHSANQVWTCNSYLVCILSLKTEPELNCAYHWVDPLLEYLITLDKIYYFGNASDFCFYTSEFHSILLALCLWNIVVTDRNVFYLICYFKIHCSFLRMQVTQWNKPFDWGEQVSSFEIRARTFEFPYVSRARCP